MSSPLEGVPAEVMQELAVWLKGSREFVASQTPDLAQQMLTWGIWSQGLASIVCGLAALAGVMALTWAVKSIREGEAKTEFYRASEKETFAFAVGGISAVLGTICFFVTLYSLVRIIVAPKLYLLEQVTRMLCG